jgi:hypothetical protein
MISREELSQEFVLLVNNYYPVASRILDRCYVKVLECYVERLGKRLYYIGVYYPEGLRDRVLAEHDAWKDIAENMGLIEVVCISATRLVRDPKSRLREENPRLWLELYWVAIHSY